MPTPRQSIEMTEVTEWQENKARRVMDYLAAEEPLQIRMNGVPLSVTMRTPGHDLELAAGFLFSEGIVNHYEQLAKIRSIEDEHSGKRNLVDVEIDQAEYDPSSQERNFFSASSCGICGKASIESIRRRGLGVPNPLFRIEPPVLYSLSDKLRSEQAIFETTGGLHAAGLFTGEGELLVLREDIGRHNAVDKIIGWAFLNKRLPLSEHVLVVSGRGGFELVQKAIAAGIPIMASVSAPSSLAVKLSRELGLTLIGFLRGLRFVVYSREERLSGPANIDTA